MQAKYSILLFGRPNVGKSTLFNQLSLETKAIVHNLPHTTIDWKETEAQLGPLSIKLTDMAGIESYFLSDYEKHLTKGPSDDPKQNINFQVVRNAIDNIKQNDLVLLVIDKSLGLSPEDQKFARMLRKYAKRVILVINKCDKKVNEFLVNRIEQESNRFGFGKPVYISAVQGLGFVDMYERISELLQSVNLNVKSDDLIESRDIIENDTELDSENADYQMQDQISLEQFEEQLPDSLEDKSPIRLAIIGRPNAGKSTLINALLKKDRMITSSLPGTTRDSVEVKWTYKGREISLVDTAGMRKKSNITLELERETVSESIEVISNSDVIILLMDARNALEKQDLKLLDLIIKEGKTVVFCFNKIDLIRTSEEKQNFKDILETSFPQLKDFPTIFVSALKNQSIYKLIELAINIYTKSSIKISTSKLNIWLKKASEYKIKGPHNKTVKLKYCLQIQSKPPVIKIFSNTTEVPEFYLRYLVRNLKKTFDLIHVPVKIVFAKSDNPYARKQ